MLAATALIALTTLLAKALGRDVAGAALHPLQVSAGRFAFAFVLVATVAAIRRPGFVDTHWRLHALRSALGWGGVTCLFAAAALMPLAEATALSFLSPILTMALAAPLLGERVAHGRWYAAALALAGAMLLIQPGTAAFQPAALVALLAAFFMAGEAICVKRLSGKEPLLRILLVNNAMAGVLALTAASFVWQAPTAAQWLMLALLGATMATVQTLFIAAMQRADASYVTPFFYATLLFAALYDLALFGERPDLLGAIGAAVIVTAALGLTLGERQRRLGAQ